MYAITVKIVGYTIQRKFIHKFIFFSFVKDFNSLKTEKSIRLPMGHINRQIYM